MSSSMWMARSAPLASASRMVCAGALRAGAQHDHLAAVLFLELQRRFQRVGVRLVDLVSQVGFLDPLARGGDAQLRIARGNLLDGDDDLHTRRHRKPWKHRGFPIQNTA